METELQFGMLMRIEYDLNRLLARVELMGDEEAARLVKEDKEYFKELLDELFEKSKGTVEETIAFNKRWKEL